MSSKRAILLLAGVLCCTAAVVQKEPETAKEMYDAEHPDVGMFGYPALLRMPNPIPGFMKRMPGLAEFLRQHLVAFYMDQVVMPVAQEEEEAVLSNPEAWVEIYDWKGDEETRFRISDDWTSEEIVDAFSKYGVRAHPILSRVLGYFQIIDQKMKSARAHLRLANHRLQNEEELAEGEKERLLEYKEVLEMTISQGESLVFDTIAGDYSPWGALDRLRYYRDNQELIDDVIHQLEELHSEAEQAKEEEKDEEKDEEEEKEESTQESSGEQDEGEDSVEDEGEDSDDEADLASALLEEESFVV